METRRSQMTDVEANISVKEHMTQITTTKNVETDLGHGVEGTRGKRKLKDAQEA
ncbi:hypothetical protein F2Q68_00004239 [Brassica cretica]|uniref:Uncharacterized protein n=1 Tax=Brassica cretica TaxID=69181 RepID=A0A8S9JMS9_BRACR|nr:hypothetical protein F2Q68_00004239 [Brassica cretica]